MEVRVLAYIRDLARRRRVLLLGGHAMILHGLERSTTDSDIWLEPLGDVSEWCQELHSLLHEYPTAYFWDLATRRRCDRSDVAQVVQQFGVIRICGMEESLDIFRRPHNFNETQFDDAWSLASALPNEEARVLSAIDLLLSKADTERQKDLFDIAYLEAKIRGDFGSVLRSCSLQEARRLFARYSDHETCRAALDNPDLAVRELAIETLRDLAAGENPFARELLASLDREPR